MTYCTNCGAPRTTGGSFCTTCGAAQAPVTTTPPAPVQPAPTQPAPATFSTVNAPLPMPAVAPKSGNGLRNFLIVAFVCLVVVVGLGIAAAIYAVRLAKEKAEVALHHITNAISQPTDQTQRPGAAKPDDSSDPSALLGNLSKLLGGGAQQQDQGDDVAGLPTGNDVPPCSTGPFPTQNGARIPLQPGTVITTAWGIINGDVEGRATVAAINTTSVDFSIHYDAYKNDNGVEQTPKTYTQTVCNQDLASSNTFMTVGNTTFPPIIHGTTRYRLSDKSFEEAKSTGKLNFVDSDIWDPDQVFRPSYDGGVLTRVEPQDVAYPMIVNDQRVTLPVIHLAGIMDSTGKDPRPKKYRPNHAVADVYVIDDPLDPIVLLWKEKDPIYHNGNFRIEVVKIDYKVAEPVNLVEKQLTEQKRAVTYGIYFDFNKDTIKPESEPVLKEIVQAMTDNPDWKLTVEGHTDNIGGDAYNLDLSKRRAAAVKEALVTRYHIAADRLANDGYGASRPVETNDTLEGRARNRRVELTRE
jgi:outer membrane protein OmpA-like peptidoglycan-associated protein